MAKLFVSSAANECGFELSAVNNIGRSSASTIQLRDPLVSKEHARIDRGPDGFTLHDCVSLNGTSVNGSRITEHRLATGDEIIVGSTKLFFVEQEGSRDWERAATSVLPTRR